MTAQELYITGLLESFSTFCERSNVPSEVFQESQLALVALLNSVHTKKSYLNDIDRFLLEFKTSSQITPQAMSLVIQFVKTYPPLQTAVFLRQYLLAVASNGCSPSTIKNYRSDINQFFVFCKISEIEKILVKPKVLTFLRNEYVGGASSATLKRKLSSLTQFGLWLCEMGVILPGSLKWLSELNSTPHLEELLKSGISQINTEAPGVNTVKTSNLFGITRLLPRAKIIPATARLNGSLPLAQAVQYTSPKHQEHNFKLKASLQELQQKLNKKTNQWLLSYLNIALIALFVIGLSYFGYIEFFVQPPATQAFPASLNRPNRTLSFQGRLTDTAQNPITSATNMRFKLYNSGPSIVGGTLLWDSGTCSVTPDQDGIFSTGLGSDCGSEIDSNVFSENTNIWLQVEVGAETLSPRQSIKTVPYAINAETLQGFPPAEIATPSSVLVMNSSGEVVLGTATPKIKSSTGTLTLEATALTLQTTANGNIALSPNGLGNIIASRYIAAPGATLSATYAGGTALVTKGGSAGTANIQEWQNSGGTALSVVNNAGNIGIGTSTASQKLTVAGNAQINNYLYFGNGTTEYTRWDGSNFIVSDDILPETNNGNDIGASGTQWNNIYGKTLYQNGLQVCDISGNCPGNEIWQNTNNVYYPKNEYADIADLVIGGNSTASADFQVIGSGANAGFTYGRRFLDKDDSNYYVDPGSTGTSGLFAGNVGIGTTLTSSAQLDLVNSGASALLMRLNNGTAQAKFEVSTGNVARLGTTSNHSFEFITNNSTRFKVMSGGNVGIASTNPGALLDVAGTASVSGSLTVGDGTTSVIRPASTANLTLQYKSNVNTWADALTVQNNSGSIGIGTSSPSQLLDINGAVRLRGAIYDYSNSPGSNSYILVNNGSGAVWTNPDAINIGWWDMTNNALYPRDEFANFADLLVGSNATASAKFGIINVATNTPSATMAGNLAITAPTGSAPATTYNILNGGTFNLQTSVGGNGGLNSRLFVSNNGNIGIGTTTTNSVLDVAGTASVSGILTLGNNSASTFRPAAGAPLSIQYKSGANAWTTALTVSNASGNIGIGTTNPAALLAVGSTSQFQVNSSGNITSIGNVAHSISDSSGALLINANSTSNLYLETNGGNVGVGTTTTAQKLDVNGGIRSFGSSSLIRSSQSSTAGGTYIQGIIDADNSFARGVFSHNAYWDPTTNLWNAENVGANDMQAILIPNNGGFQFITHASTGSTARTMDHTTFTAGTKMTILSNGNVGIGTTTPSRLFHVQGDMRLTGALYDSTNSAGTPNYILVTNGSGTVWTNPDAINIGWWDMSNNALYPRDEYAGVVDLLVGSTATATAKFGIINVATNTPSATMSGNLAITAPTGSSPATTYNIFNNGTFALQTSPGGDAGLNPRLFVANNGSVGIGTTTNTSGHRLDINGNLFTSGGGVYTSNNFVFGSSTGNGEYFAVSGNDINMLAGGGTRIHLDGDGGSVGIGTTSPSQVLDVNGDLRVRGNDITDSADTTRLTFGTGTLTLDSTTTTLTASNLGTFTTAATLNMTSTTAVNLGNNAALTLGANVNGGKLYGSSANSGILTIEGTSSVTKTTSYVNIQPTGGSVGIGTTTPTQLLDVNGGIRLRGAVYDYNNSAGTPNYVLVNNGSGAVWTNPDAINIGWWDMSNNALYPRDEYAGVADLLVGSNATATAKFGIINVATTTPSATMSGNLAITAPTGASPATTYNIFNNGTFAIQTSPGGNAGLNPRLFIANAGNIGINSTSPAYRLDVNGTAGISGLLTTSAGISNTGALTTSGGTVNINTGTSNATVTIGGGSNTVTVNANTGSFTTGTWAINSAGVASGLTGLTSSGTITFSGLTANRLVTTNGSSQLSTSITSANLAASITDESGSGVAVFNNGPTFLTNSVTFSAITNDITTGTNEHLAIMPNGTGNVGIGTTNPSSLLEVSGSTLPAFEVAGTQLLRYKYGPQSYDVSSAPMVLKYTDSTGGGSGAASFMIYFKARDDANIQLDEVWYFGTQAQYNSNGYTYTMQRISGTKKVRVYEITNTGSNLEIQWTLTDDDRSAVAGRFNDSIEVTVMEVLAGHGESHRGTFAMETWATKSLAGSEINNGGNAHATFGGTGTNWLMGSVGIGTTTPTQLLDINGGIRLRGAVYDYNNSAGTPNYVLVNNGSGAVWTNPDAINIGWWDMSNNALYPRDEYAGVVDLLVGSTATATAKFGIINVATNTPSATMSGNLSITVPTGTLVTPASTVNILNGGTLDFQTSVGGNSALNSRLFIANAGNIGINSTSPAYRLDVNGTAGISGLLTTSAGISNTGALTTSGGTVNINTGTSNATVTIGGGSNTVTVNANTGSFTTGTWAINSAGVASGLTGLTSSGTITFSGLTANRLVTTNGSSQLSTSITSANLAASITDESGSGVAVFNNGPTFLTNSVTFSAITNDITTGTNEHLAIMPNGTGNVGIGTASPGRLLQVQGDMRLTGALYDSSDSAGSSGNVLTSTGTGTAWAAPSAVYNTGWWDNTSNVIHPRNHYADFADLAIGGNSTASADFQVIGGGANAGYVYGRRYIDMDSTSYYVDPGNTSIAAAFAGNVGIGTTSPTSYNLHIRNAADSSILLEGDTDNTTESDNAFLKLSQDGGAVGAIFGFTGATNIDPEGTTYTGTLDNATLLGTLDSNGGLQFGTNDVVRMTITSGGNVGVGTTAPLALLDVAGTASASGVFTLGNNSASTLRPATNAPLTFQYKSGANSWATSMTISNTNGNIGVGTTTMGEKIDVAGNVKTSGNDRGFIAEGTTANTIYSSLQTTSWAQTASWFANSAYTGSGDPISNSIYKVDAGGYSTSAGMMRYLGNGGSWQFFTAPTSTGAGNTITWTQTASLGQSSIWLSPTGSSSTFTINSSGNVGIGTASPGRKLQVQGDMRLTGALYDSSNSAGTSGYVLTSNGTSGTSWTNAESLLDSGWWDNTQNVLHPRSEYAGVADLVVGGNSTASADFQVIGSGSDAGYVYGKRFIDKNDSNYYIEPGSNTYSALFKSMVGIGTTTPMGKLHLYGDEGMYVESDKTANMLPSLTTINRAGGTGTNYSGTKLFNKVDAASGNNNRSAFFRQELQSDYTVDTTYELFAMDFYGDNHYQSQRRGAWLYTTGALYLQAGLTEPSDTSGDIADTANAQVALTTAGNFGIGSITPGEKVVAAGSIIANAEDTFIGADASGNSRLGFAKKSGSSPVIAAGSATPLSLGFWSTTSLGGGNVGTGTFSEKVRLETSGNLGIGTTVPGALLAVGATSNFTINSSGNITKIGNVAHSISDSSGNLLVNANSTSHIIMQTNGGGVSIGTTANPNAYPNTTNTIASIDSGDIWTTISGGSGTPSILNLQNSLDTDGGTIGGLIFTRSGGQSDAHRNVAGIIGVQKSTGTTSGAELQFWTKAGSSPAQRMVLDRNGNLGIGSTAPGTTLDVTGTASISSTLTVGSDTAANIRPASIGSLNLQYKSAANTWASGITLQNISGSVGIGTTTAITNTLDVNGTVRVRSFGAAAATNVCADANGVLSTCSGGFVTGSGTTNYLARWTNSSNIGIGVTYDDGTNVAIGTTVPQAKLDVSGTASVSGILTLGDGSASTLRPASGSPLTLQYKSGANAWTSGVTLSPNGNVGIATTTPVHLLELNTSGTTAAAGISIGPAATNPVEIFRGAADRLDLASGDAFNMVSGLFTQVAPVATGTGTSAGHYINNSTLSSGNLFELNSTANSISSGKVFSLTKSGTGSTAFTGDIMNIAYTHTFNAGTALGHTGNVLDISRAITVSGGTHTISGALATLADSVVSGSPTHTASVLDVTQNYTSSSGNAIYFKNYGTGNSLRVDDASGDTTPFLIDAAGNVGVGTTAVTTNLQVYGAGTTFQVAATTTANRGLYYTEAGNDLYVGGSSSQDGNIFLNNLSGTATVGLNSAGVSYFTGGNVGIGISSAGDLLTLDQATVAQGKEMIRLSTGAGASSWWHVGLDTSNFLTIGSGATNSQQFTFNTSGNLGVGTSVPDSKLDVEGTSAANGEIAVQVNNVTTTGYSSYRLSSTVRMHQFNSLYPASGGWEPNAFAIANSAGNINLISESATGDIKFYTNGHNQRMIIDEAGNVGVGTATPNNKFDVSVSTDGLVAYRPADNTMALQVYLDGQWSNRTTYASGCCNELALQPDVGNVSIGTTASRGGKLDIYGGPSWTTSNWAKSLYMTNGSMMRWSSDSGTYTGFGHTTGAWYWATSTADDNSAAASYPMSLTNTGSLSLNFTDTASANSGANGSGNAQFITAIDSANLSSGTDSIRGLNISATRTGTMSGTAVHNTIGLKAAATSATGGTSAYAYGGYFVVNGTSPTFISGVVSESTVTTGGVGYGIKSNASGAGTGYGVYAEAFSTGTNYGVYSAVGSGSTNYSGIFTGGSVGIGVTAPAQLLDVQGTIQATLASSGTTAVCWTNTLTDANLTDCSGTPTADYMEMYPMTTDVSTGDLVGMTTTMATTIDGDQIPVLTKTTQPYQRTAIGVASDKAKAGDFNSIGYNIKENDNPHPVALKGRVPVKVTTINGTINPGDYITTSSIPGAGMKATQAGWVVGKALTGYSNTNTTEISTVMVYVESNWYDPGFSFTSDGELVLNGSNGIYTVTQIGSNSPIVTIISAASGVFGKVRAGLVSTQELVVEQSAQISSLSVNSLTVAGQSIQDYVAGLVQQQLATTPVLTASGSAQLATASAQITNLSTQNSTTDALSAGTITAQTATISSSLTAPTALIADLTTQDLTATGTTALGSLMAETATISGSISAAELNVTGTSRLDIIQAQQAELADVKATTASLLDATVSGTLYVENIYDLDGKISRALQQPGIIDIITNNLPEPLPEADPVSVYNDVESAGYTINPDMLSVTGSEVSLVNGDIILTAQAAYVEKYLQVNGLAYIAQSLGVGQSIILGNSTIITDRSIAYAPTSSDDTFYFQPTGQGKLDFLAGVMTIENGKVAITGSLTVAGTTKTETLLTNLIQPADFGNPFQVQVAGISTQSGELKKSRFEIVNELGTPVATISAEGKANFAGGIGIGSETLSTPEVASGSSATVIASKTSGKSTLGAHATQLTIESDQITENSLIYVTPVSSTQNQVLYVKSQTPENPTTGEKEGKFVVGFDQSINTDVNFNWWIIN